MALTLRQLESKAGKQRQKGANPIPQSPTEQGLGEPAAQQATPSPPPIGIPGTGFGATRPIPGPASPLDTDELRTTLAQVLDRQAGGMKPTAELGSREPTEASVRKHFPSGAGKLPVRFLAYANLSPIVCKQP